MAHAIETMYPRGSTSNASDELAELAGKIGEFPDVEWDSSEGVKPVLTGSMVRCRWVQNTSGGALLPGRLVAYDAAAPLKEVDVLATTGEQAAGVVDEYLPAAGVANNMFFWLVIDGPTTVVSDGAGVIAAQDKLVTGATGYVVEQTAAPANETAVMVQVNAYVGHALEAAAASEGTTLRALVRLHG